MGYRRWAFSTISRTRSVTDSAWTARVTRPLLFFSFAKSNSIARARSTGCTRKPVDFAAARGSGTDGVYRAASVPMLLWTCYGTDGAYGATRGRKNDVETTCMAALRR
eukprot:3906603-Rhodomonas_salina.1